MINSGPGCSRLSVLLLGAAMGWCRNFMQKNGLAWRSETNDANVWGALLAEALSCEGEGTELLVCMEKAKQLGNGTWASS